VRKRYEIKQNAKKHIRRLKKRFFKAVENQTEKPKHGTPKTGGIKRPGTLENFKCVFLANGKALDLATIGNRKRVSLGIEYET
jgi:hypothetical protein